jgi:hypothetical protein
MILLRRLTVRNIVGAPIILADTTIGIGAGTEAETAHTNGPMRLRNVLVVIFMIVMMKTAETGGTPTGQNRANPLPGVDQLMDVFLAHDNILPMLRMLSYSTR